MLLCGRQYLWTLWCHHDISWDLLCILSGHSQVHTYMPVHNLQGKPKICKQINWCTECHIKTSTLHYSQPQHLNSLTTFDKYCLECKIHATYTKISENFGLTVHKAQWCYKHPFVIIFIFIHFLWYFTDAAWDTTSTWEASQNTVLQSEFVGYPRFCFNFQVWHLV